MDPHQFSVRQATEADLDSVTQLFRETILHINSMDYAPEQTNVWSAAWENREQWLSRIRNQYFLLAFSGGELAGFGSVESSGYLDMLYTGKDYQRRGVATALLNGLEEYVYRQNVAEIFAHVSIAARPFFERHGFSIVKEQRKMLGGVDFVNFYMRKIVQ